MMKEALTANKALEISRALKNKEENKKNAK
jgi:hypothetical protein